MKPVAVLSTTVIPIDGVYEIRTVEPDAVDIEGVPHYIGHPSTRQIVEGMGAVPAPSNLFPGLEPGEYAVCFAISQGKSKRRELGFTVPHQDVALEDLTCRIIRRLS